MWAAGESLGGGVSAKKTAPLGECSVDRTKILQSEERRYSLNRMRSWFSRQDSREKDITREGRQQSEEPMSSFKDMESWLNQEDSYREKNTRERLQSEERKNSLKQMRSWFSRQDSREKVNTQEGRRQSGKSMSTIKHMKSWLGREDSFLEKNVQEEMASSTLKIETDDCISNSHVNTEKGATTTLDAQGKKNMGTKLFSARHKTKTLEIYLKQLQQRGRSKKGRWRKQTASCSPVRSRASQNKGRHEHKKPGDKLHRMQLLILRMCLSLQDLSTLTLFAEDFNAVETDFTDNVDMETKEISPLGKLGQRRNCPGVGMLVSPPINGSEDGGKFPGFNTSAATVDLQKTNKESSAMPSPVIVHCCQQEPVMLHTGPSDIINDEAMTHFKTSRKNTFANALSEELSQHVDVSPHSEMSMTKNDEFITLSAYEQVLGMVGFSGSNEGSLTKRVAYNNGQSKGASSSFIKTFRTRPALDYEVEAWLNDEEESIGRLDLKCKNVFQPPGDSRINMANVNPSQGVRRPQCRTTPPKLKEEKSFNTDIKITELPTTCFKMMRHVKLSHRVPDVRLEIPAMQPGKCSWQRSSFMVLRRSEYKITLPLTRFYTWPASIFYKYRNSIRMSRADAADEDGKSLLEDSSKLVPARSARFSKPTAITLFDTDTCCTSTSTFSNSTISDVYDIFDDMSSGNNSFYLVSSVIDELADDDVDETYLQNHENLYEIMHSVPHLHFEKLPVEKQAKLMRQLKPERYMRNEYIFKKGDQSCSFYFICGPQSGMLDNELAGVSVVVDDMGEQITCHLDVGSYFGERALICSNETTRSETVKVISAFVDVVRVGQENFADWNDFRTYAILKDICWLSGLPSATLHALQGCLKRVDFTDGSHIVQKGDIGDAFYIVSTGTVEVIDIGEDGREIPLVQLYEGQAFGDLALLYGEPRNATVKAKHAVSCLVLGKDDFRGYLEEEGFVDVLEREAHARQTYIERRKKVRDRTTSVDTFGNLNLNCCMERKRKESFDLELTRGSGFGVATPQLSTPHEPITTPILNRQRLKNGIKIINKYEILKELGKGAYGTVMLAKHLDTQNLYAMKILNKGRKHSKVKCQLTSTLRHEVAVMKRLRHPNIVTLWEVIDDPNAHQLYLIQDYMDGGGVLPETCPVPPLDIMTARLQLVDCVRGLHYLHSNRIIHGDIKPANLLTDSRGLVKIADFGAARIIRKEEQPGVAPGGELLNNPTMINLIGTPAFMAPELFGEDGIHCVGPETDVWALGVTLFQMIHGTLPFWYKGCTQREFEMRIRYKKLDIPLGEVESHGLPSWSPRRPPPKVDNSFEGLGDPLWPSLRNLLKRFLDKDPKSRISLNEVILHPWVTVEGSWPQEPLEQESSYCCLEITQNEIQNTWLQLSPKSSSPMGPSPRNSSTVSFFCESPSNESRYWDAPSSSEESQRLVRTICSSYSCSCVKQQLPSMNYSLGSNCKPPLKPPPSSRTSTRDLNCPEVSFRVQQHTSDSVSIINDGANLQLPPPKYRSESAINRCSESSNRLRQPTKEKGMIEMGGAENAIASHPEILKQILKREFPCKGTSFLGEELKQSKVQQISSRSAPPIPRAINHSSTNESTSDTSSLWSITGYEPETSSSDCFTPNRSNSSTCKNFSTKRFIGQRFSGRATTFFGKSDMYLQYARKRMMDFPIRRYHSTSFLPRTMSSSGNWGLEREIICCEKGRAEECRTAPGRAKAAEFNLSRSTEQQPPVPLLRKNGCFLFKVRSTSTQSLHNYLTEEDNDSLYSEDFHASVCDDLDQVVFNSKPTAYNDPSLLPLYPSEFQSLDISKPVQSKTFCFQTNDLLGVRFGRGCEQGNQEHMEDCYVAIGDLLSVNLDPSIQPEVVQAAAEEQTSLLDDTQRLEAAAFFAVYDGHNGAYVATTLQKSLHHCLLLQPSFPSEMATAVENACKEVDEACLIAQSLHLRMKNNSKYGIKNGESSVEDDGVKPSNNMFFSSKPCCKPFCLQTVKNVYEVCSKEEKFGGAASFAGSTAIIAVLARPPSIDQSVYLWIANVGDCRAVLCRNNVAVELSVDQTPRRESEAERIIAANGFINHERLSGMLGALCASW